MALVRRHSPPAPYSPKERQSPPCWSPGEEGRSGARGASPWPLGRAAKHAQRPRPAAPSPSGPRRASPARRPAARGRRRPRAPHLPRPRPALPFGRQPRPPASPRAPRAPRPRGSPATGAGGGVWRGVGGRGPLPQPTQLSLPAGPTNGVPDPRPPASLCALRPCALGWARPPPAPPAPRSGPEGAQPAGRPLLRPPRGGGRRVPAGGGAARGACGGGGGNLSPAERCPFMEEKDPAQGWNPTSGLSAAGPEEGECGARLRPPAARGRKGARRRAAAARDARGGRFGEPRPPAASSELPEVLGWRGGAVAREPAQRSRETLKTF